MEKVGGRIMSIENVDFSKVGRVLVFGVLVWLLSFLAVWASGVEWLPAAKVGVGVAVGWISGNLAETGLAVPSMEGLRK